MQHAKISVFIIIILLFLAACNGDDDSLPPPQPRNTAAAVNANQPTPVPYVTRLVTLTPRPTTPATPTATLPFEVLPIEGTWLLMINLAIQHDDMVGTIQYSMSTAVNISMDGSVTGSGTFTKYVEYVPCPIEVRDEGQRFTISGSLMPSGEGRNAQLQLTLIPEAPDMIEQFSIRCFQGDSQIDRPVEAQILWPAIQANNLLSFTFDMSQEYHSLTFEGEGLTGDLYFGR